MLRKNDISSLYTRLTPFSLLHPTPNDVPIVEYIVACNSDSRLKVSKTNSTIGRDLILSEKSYPTFSIRPTIINPLFSLLSFYYFPRVSIDLIKSSRHLRESCFIVLAMGHSTTKMKSRCSLGRRWSDPRFRGNVSRGPKSAGAKFELRPTGDIPRLIVCLIVK